MDTSFVLSHLHDDGHTEEAREWIRPLSGPGVISPLVRLEFHNMLWRKVGHDGFERGHADEIISEFEDQIEGGWFVLERVDRDRLDERAMGVDEIVCPGTQSASPRYPACGPGFGAWGAELLDL